MAEETESELTRKRLQEETAKELERFANWLRKRFPDDEIRKKILMGLVHSGH